MFYEKLRPHDGSVHVMPSSILDERKTI